MAFAGSSFRRRNILAALSLIGIDLVVYGPFVSSLGFSYNDWPVVSIYSLFGRSGLHTYFTGNRPAVGWLSVHLFPVIGVHPLGWHLLMVLVLSLTAVATFFTFNALWPGRGDLAWLTAALILLYPGFTQHSEALSFVPHYISLLLFILSLRVTLAALNGKFPWLLTGLAIVLALASYTLTEYFIGLELLRFLVIKHRMQHNGLPGKAISPYLVAWIPFLIWRGLFDHSADYASYKDPTKGLHQLARHPIPALIDRASAFAHNIIFSAGLAWFRPIGPQLVNRSNKGLAVEYGLGVSVAVIAFLVLRAFRKTEVPERNFGQNLMLATGAVLVSGLPLVLSTLRSQFNPFPSFDDRFSLPFILASALLAALLLIRLGSVPLIAGLLCLFTVFQAQSQVSYVRDWALLRSLFWQEVWRAPMLDSGTSVYLDGTPKTIVHSHDAGMLDLLYGAKPAPRTLNYYPYDLEHFQPNLKAGSIAVGSVHEFQFHGQMVNSIVQWLSPDGVLHTVGDDPGVHYSGICDALAPISAPDRVVQDRPLRSYPLLSILGREPQHDWSYYYQRAELKRQEHDWNAIAQLGDEAQHSRFRPTEGSELLPFIEGYARMAQYDAAERLTLQVLAQSPELERPLSTLWSSILLNPPGAAPSGVSQILGEKLDITRSQGRIADMDGSPPQR